MSTFPSTSPKWSRSFRALVGVIVLVSTTALSAAERQALKLLHIGNSFSVNATHFLPDIARAGGKDLVLGGAVIGGCSLERHARHLKEAEAGDPQGQAYEVTDPKTGTKRMKSLPELLKEQAWDIVTIQQWSQLSFKPETFQPHADQLIAAVRRYAPTAEIVVHETWAYREDHEFFQRGDGFTPAAMYTRLSAAYKNFAREKGFRVLPVGDAFALARRTPRWTYQPDPTFDFKNPPAGQVPDQRTSLNVGWQWTTDKEGKKNFTLDAIHCNAAGAYLGAAVWYQVLFGTDKVPASFVPPGLTAADTADLRVHAHAAVDAQQARELTAGKSR